MAGKFAHESLTELHDFVFAFSFRVKVRAAFATAHGDAGKRIFENLLKRQKFQYTHIHRRMKANSAFVGPDGAVHLNAITAVNLYFTFIVKPGNTKGDESLRLKHAFQDFQLPEFRVLVQRRQYRDNYFFGCL